MGDTQKDIEQLLAKTETSLTIIQEMGGKGTVIGLFLCSLVHPTVCGQSADTVNRKDLGTRLVSLLLAMTCSMACL